MYQVMAGQITDDISGELMDEMVVTTILEKSIGITANNIVDYYISLC